MMRKEVGVFLIVGCLTVLVDYLTYRGIVWLGLLGIDHAKAAGFVTGTVFAYFANRFWTFSLKKHAPGSAWRFAILYAATLVINVYANSLMLRILSQIWGSIQIAFVIATGISATLNFVGMKFFVFAEAKLRQKA